MMRTHTTSNPIARNPEAKYKAHHFSGRLRLCVWLFALRGIPVSGGILQAGINASTAAKKLEPAASVPLLLASRAQHIGRWKTPRDKYPAGKAGYLSWRKDLAKFHAQTAGELMLEAGYGEHEVNGVKQIILKETYASNTLVSSQK